MSDCKCEPYDGHTYMYDLGWIVCQLKLHQTRLEDIQKELDNIESQIAGLPAYVQKLVQQYTADLRAQIEKQLADNNARMDAVEARIDTTQAVVSDLQNQLLELSQAIVNLVAFVEIYTDRIGEQVFAKLKAYVDEWSKDLPPVTCPVDGNLESVSTALRHVYDSTRDGLTAAEYDGSQLTAAAYDDTKVSAIQYDTRAKSIFDRWRNYMMISPFTGAWVTIASVVQKLADFHRMGLTAEVYDEYSHTAGEYDAHQITAYAYDWDNPLRV